MHVKPMEKIEGFKFLFGIAVRPRYDRHIAYGPFEAYRLRITTTIVNRYGTGC